MSVALITGGSGHVGANLVRELSNRGYKERCIDFDGAHSPLRDLMLNSLKEVLLMSSH